MEFQPRGASVAPYCSDVLIDEGRVAVGVEPTRGVSIGEPTQGSRRVPIVR